MIKAGIPITEGLTSLVDNSRSAAFKKVISNVLSSVETGHSFAKSLAKHPSVFDDFYISLIRVGEETGNLEENLKYLSSQLSKDYSLRKKVRGALVYPALILSLTAILGGGISIFVLPKLLEFFEVLEVELPLTTRILILFATVMKDHGIFIMAAVISLSTIFVLAIRLPMIKPIWHKFLIKIPIIGKFLIYGQLVRFSRNFGMLLKSGIPVTKSMDITADTLSNIKFKEDLRELVKHLEKGKNISKALSQAKYNEFPPIVVKMIAVGEKTGKLDETLIYLANFYEDEIDDMSKTLPTTIEPILLISIGIVVGFVALSIITPIYELTGAIGR